MNKFTEGQYVVAYKNVEFMDDTQHKQFHIYKITKDTLAYFNCFPNDYGVVDNNLRTAETWLVCMGDVKRILDYDGWETKKEFYFDKVSFDVFITKLNMCTVESSY